MKKMDTSKKQTTRKSGVAGKKRKKKKPSKDASAENTASKEKGNRESCLQLEYRTFQRGKCACGPAAKSAKELGRELGAVKRNDLAVALTVHKIEERCSSSSSSVENQRPKEKMGR